MDNEKPESLNDLFSDPVTDTAPDTTSVSPAPAPVPEVPAEEAAAPEFSGDDVPRIELEIERKMPDADAHSMHHRLCESLDSIVFKAGRVDVEYEDAAKISCQRPSGENASCSGKFHTFNFDKYGLECTCVNGTIRVSGKPTRKYDGVIKVVLKDSYEIRQTETPAGKNGSRTPRRYGCVKTYKFDDFVAERQFVINPDPWTLWEEHEPAADTPYPKPHVEHESGVVPCEEGAAPLTVLAASRRGRSHAHAATFRDDHFAMKLGENVGDWNFFVVADGAGSAKYSRQGSKIACETAISWMNTLFNGPDHGPAILARIREQIAQKRRGGSLLNDASIDAAATGVDRLFYYVPYYVYTDINLEVTTRLNKDSNAKLKDYSSTLLCAAIKRLEATADTPAMWLIISYWVGDGGIVVDRPNAENYTLTLTEPDSGDFAGQTRFITMRDQIDHAEVSKRVRISVVPNFKALMLMTDGITDPFFPAEEDIKRYDLWEEFWRDQFPEHFPGVLDESKSLKERAKALEDDLNFKVKGNHDDRTFVLILGKEEKIELEPVQLTLKDDPEGIIGDQPAVEPTAAASDPADSEPTVAAASAAEPAEPNAEQSPSEPQSVDESAAPTDAAPAASTDNQLAPPAENSPENPSSDAAPEATESVQLPPPPAEIVIVQPATGEASSEDAVNLPLTPKADENDREASPEESLSSSDDNDDLPPPPEEITLVKN